MDVDVTFEDGTTDSIQLTPGDPHMMIEFRPGIDNAIDTVIIHGDLGDLITEVEFYDKCVPEYPVYIRWINTLGGFEYYMFENNKSYARSANPTNITPGESYRHHTLRSKLTLSMEVEDTIDLGEGNLNLDEFRMLGEILTSPKIEYWNTDLEQWETCVLSGKTTAEWNTRNSRGQVGFTLRMLDQPIQI